ncbi:hypothetical protein LTS18_007779 [Coniosporium uncinatum]|uniref:Uncharacterized protein n=1 Tax=Coniosporium uncinatum TaxID=93489 RepID=A0ACC3DXV5_9PEZI|nr:hypothetical protein LTS18_007779 [Coniosporium uncinatum]
MLREQDDPNSKLGKASDDSVLQPQRQSRLFEYGFSRGLGDIVETSSVRSAIRPPFAASDRQHSIGSMEGYGTDDDSVHNGNMMTRSRPGEGNVLFGGRQKIYKIPIGASGSTKSFGSSSGNSGMRGRPGYDADVSMSGFQRLRHEERERERIREQERQRKEQKSYEPESPPRSRPYSPSLSGWSRRRGTASSTTSEAARSSTAATSIASNDQPPPIPKAASSAQPTSFGVDRSNPKGRRLYEQGLDREMQAQHSSAITRLNSIQKQRLGGKTTPPYRSQSRNGERAEDRMQRAAQPLQSQPARSFSNGESTHGSPPASPLGRDFDDSNPLAMALDPNDRGKATALGTFNKPQKFDEHQYLQRQMRLQQGRETPTPKDETPPIFDEPPVKEEDSAPPPPAKDDAPLDSGSGERSEPTSSGQEPAPTAFSLFQKAASQMAAPQASSGAAQSTDRDGPTSPPTSQVDYSKPLPAGPLYDGRHYVKKILLPASNSSNIAPPVQEHPTFRTASPLPPAEVNDVVSPKKQQVEGKSYHGERETSVATVKAAEDQGTPDGPLSPDVGGGLSGMVRQHLRNNSNVSSIYSTAPPAPLGVRTRDASNLTTHSMCDSDTPAHSTTSHSNPWDLEDFEGGYPGEADNRSSVSPADIHRMKHNDSSSVLSSRTYEEPTEGEDVPWQQQMKKQHNRGLSSQTQAEREAFANDLAQRQRDIQQALKGNVLSEQHSTSPSPSSKNGGLKVIGVLRSKSSRDSLARNNPESQKARALKMLGLAPDSHNPSGAVLSRSATSLDDYPNADERTGRAITLNPRSRSPLPAMRVPQQPASEARKESDNNDQSSAASTRQTRSFSASTSKSSGRPSADSEVSSSRSRSRTGRYKDDLDKAMAEGTGSRSNSTYYVEPIPTLPDQPSSRIPQEFQTASAGNSSTNLAAYFSEPTGQPSNRFRSNSRLAGPSYFDQKNLHPVQSLPSPRGVGANLNSPASSPGSSPRPSPSLQSPGFKSMLAAANTNYTMNPTPPGSGTSTPVHHPYGSANSRTQSGAYKKSINKYDISEPKLLKMTADVDLVDLPPGASLRNGLEEVQASAPPAPPVLPKKSRRRRFGFGRSETADPSSSSTSRNPSPADSNTWSADELDKRA